MQKGKLIFIFGPTGAGKTESAVKAARGIGEIISVDSMQVYKKIDRGTAKPTPRQLHEVNHHLVSIVQPDYRFSAGDFKRRATRAISEIYSRGKIPFLVGGTGLYFKALEYNLADAPGADVNIREKLYKEEEKKKGELYSRLQNIDPPAAGGLHPNDLVRIVRALEVYYVTGRRFSDVINQESAHSKYRIMKIGICPERDDLYKKLEKRCIEMVNSGLAYEVYGLLNRGYTESFPSMKGLGYSHFIQYFKGCCSWSETIRLFIRDTRRYAKRQLTWFRKEQDAVWYSPDACQEIRRRIESFIAGNCES